MHVRDTSQVRWNSASTVGEWGEGSATWKTSVDECTGCGASSGAGELDGGAGGDGSGGCAGGHGQGCEGSDGQVGAGWAGGDEACSEGEDGTDAKRCVECGGDGCDAGRCADEGGMSGLDGDDLGGDSKNSWGLDERSGSEVSGPS